MSKREHKNTLNGICVAYKDVYLFLKNCLDERERDLAEYIDYVEMLLPEAIKDARVLYEMLARTTVKKTNNPVTLELEKLSMLFSMYDDDPNSYVPADERTREMRVTQRRKIALKLYKQVPHLKVHLHTVYAHLIQWTDTVSITVYLTKEGRYDDEDDVSDNEYEEAKSCDTSNDDDAQDFVVGDDKRFVEYEDDASLCSPSYDEYSYDESLESLECAPKRARIDSAHEHVHTTKVVK